MKLMRAALFSVCAAAMAVAQAPTVLFYEPFNDNSAGWTLGTEWEIGPAQSSSGGNFGNGDPANDGSGVPGGGVAGVNIGGNYVATAHDYRYLTSPTIDLGGQAPGVTLLLSYRRFLNSDYPPYMTNRLQVFDGTNWTTIWDTASNTFFIEDSAWSTPTFDVTPYANPAFAVRWGFNKTATSIVLSGWNLDNVRVAAFAPIANDACASATPLGLGVTNGHLVGATGTNPQPTSCGSFTTSSTDCWYTFSTPVGGNFDFTRAGGSRMALYTGADCSTLVQVPGRCGTGTTFTNVAVAPNTTYWLRLGGPLNSEHAITVALRASLATIGVGSPVGTVLSGSGAPVLGSVGSITLDAEPFRFGLLLIAPPNEANLYTPIGVGTIYLANPGLAVLLSYYTDAAGQWSLTVPFPADPAYTGFALELQCLNFGPFAPETSNALRLVMGS